MTDVDVTKNEQLSRYEAHLDGSLAGYAEYDDDGSVVTFSHTVTEPEFGGRGVASALARHSLDEVRAAGRTVRPTCSFYAGWIDKHPDYQDLLAR
ncbi:GNAT family N-acetyltransferase [Piscicoccus intestinalis]|uniref:GNAT family N-acetyltransferase n=1 Tax=Piscicoccus intestinalis TaxID=746033 RepID=UPI000838AC75|nr:GNAT family N-acetyltransferase [Piscicoccus intestinalis]